MNSFHQPRGTSWNTERRALQIVVAVACLVPLLAGGLGMIQGVPSESVVVDRTGIALDSHFRYLSGLLFAIGLGFAASIHRIETHGRRILLLTSLVVVGGLGRLLGLILVGVPSRAMLAALAMELMVTPLLALWQFRIAKRSGTGLASARGELPR